MQKDRKTKIVATLGPATASKTQMRKLVEGGVSVCRLNFSHGTHEEHGKMMKLIRSVQTKDMPVSIMMDTKGPEVRTGDTKEPMAITKGKTYAFSFKTPRAHGSCDVIRVDYKDFSKDAKIAQCILVDNGSMEFRVRNIAGGIVYAKAMGDGLLRSRRHINLPGASLRGLPPFTARDWKDIAYGVQNKVDYIATSFVRTHQDVVTLRKYLNKKKSTALIIAKVETPQAVACIDDIIRESDGIMVARGDLGAEVPYENVPSIQKMIIEKCRDAGKPVIVATHMLESMINSPMPTRAEVTDIAFAASLQADCTMLSGETATGLYPMKALEVMRRVLERNEHAKTPVELSSDCSCSLSDAEACRREQTYAACVLAGKLCADAILVMTRTGLTARAVSASRPNIPIHAFTESASVQQQLAMSWGITPHRLTLARNPETTVTASIGLLKKKGTLKKGQRVVVVSDIRTGKTSTAMTIQIRTIS